MAENVVLTINMDKRCSECGKPGAAGSGICMRCALKAMGDKPMKSRQGQAAQARFKCIMTRRDDG